MTIKFYLAKKPRWAELWDSIRAWIEKGSRFKGKEILPWSFDEAARSAVPYEEGGDSVKIDKLEDEVTIIYSRRAEGRKWTTRIFVKRSAKSVYCEIAVSCEDPSVDVIAPRIADTLYGKFGGLNKKVISDTTGITFASVTRQLDRIEHKVEETNGLINRMWDWFRNAFMKFFLKVFGVRNTAKREDAEAMLARSDSYLKCFEKTKMKEPHLSQVKALVEYVRNGHPIDYDPGQESIQNKTAYTINHAAAELLRRNAEPCHSRPGAWTRPKDLADACRAYMRKKDDPFIYKT